MNDGGCLRGRALEGVISMAISPELRLGLLLRRGDSAEGLVLIGILVEEV